MEIANKYQENGWVEFSHPNFISQLEKHQQVIPNDSYFNNQFAFHNTGQQFNDGHTGSSDADIDAPECWHMSRGSNNIVIAVLDEGVTPDHPDLPNTRQVRLNGSNFTDGDPNDPSPTNNMNHGNSCAGVIAATQNNGQGITGVCPNCRIMPVRIFDSNPSSGLTSTEIADAIDFARVNGADIISNSWGYGSDNPNLYPVIVNAIQTATTQGRGGLGCVMVFSAGNNLENDGPVHFPSNVNISGVLTVGASDRYDQKSYYSPLGDPSSPNNQYIDVVAPSHRAYPNQISGETFEAWSIDIPNNSGYNPWPEYITGSLQTIKPPPVGEELPNTGVNFLAYTGRFGGTSHSCPVVSGIAGLILSVNPNLTQQEVFNIITSTADKVGGYVYSSGISNEMGYGRVNACEAVLNTVPNTSINGDFPPGSCSVGTTRTFSITNPVAGVPYSWTVSNGLQIVGSEIGPSVSIKILSNGPQWIKANVTAACGSRTLATRNFSWLSHPGFTNPTVDDQPYYVGSCHGVCDGYHWAELTVNGASPYDMSWTLDPPGAVNWQWVPSSSQIEFEVIPYYTTFPFYFEGSVTNSCGTGQFTFCFIEGPCGYSYSFSPNPVSDELVITRSNSETADNSEELEIVVYNSSMEMVYNVKSSESSIRVPMNGLPEGDYFLHVINKEGIHREHLVVKR